MTTSISNNESGSIGSNPIAQLRQKQSETNIKYEQMKQQRQQQLQQALSQGQGQG